MRMTYSAENGVCRTMHSKRLASTATSLWWVHARAFSLRGERSISSKPPNSARSGRSRSPDRVRDVVDLALEHGVH